MVHIAVTNGEHRLIFELKEGGNLIGRPDPDARLIPQLNLETLDLEGKVSRRHANIEVADDKMLLEDLGSLNGTYLMSPLDASQTKLEQGRKYPVRLGDRFVIGKLILQVID
jgi:pSer/pThr/pTyr-binding forkhead associated (FHA) protein